MEVDVREAESQFEWLLKRAVAGEGVIITVDGRPVVRLVRVDQDEPGLGSARGEFVLGEGWDAPLSDGEVEGLLGE